MIILLLGILLFVMVGVPIFTTGFAFLWYFGKFVLWAVKAILITICHCWKTFWEEMYNVFRSNINKRRNTSP